MRPAQVVTRAAGYLERHGIESPVPTAERLLAHVLGTDRAGLYVREGLTTQEAKRFGRALCRRCAGEPLQHVTGEQGFRRLSLAVGPGVFVPRPETEVLVAVALAGLDGRPSPTVIDVGTGTGAVALAVKDERPDARVLATDVSTDAVALATRNAEQLGLDVTVLRGDLLGEVADEMRGEVDAVLANPPYVPPEEHGSLPAEVLADPEAAVFGTIELYRRLFEQAAAALRPGGLVAVEIHERAAAAVTAAARGAGFVEVEVTRDLAGRDRVVSARRRPPS